MKKLAYLLSFILCFTMLCTVTPVSAADTSTDMSEEIITISEYTSGGSSNYGWAYMSSSESGHFSVTTTKSGTISLTLKTETSDSSTLAYLQLKKGSTVYKSSVTLSGASTKTFTIYNAPAGTYDVYFTCYTNAGTRIMCWMY